MMNWLFFALVVVVVMGVLNAPISLFDDTQKLLTDDFWMDVLMGTLVVGCIFLCHQCWRTAYISHKLGRWLSFLVGGVLMMVVATLFMIKAQNIRFEHEHFVPKDTYTITATVHINQISDGVYHQTMGTHYRQKAQLSELRLVDNTHKYANNTKTTSNPFGGDDITQNIILPNTMTVLLTAFANEKQDFGVLSLAKPNTKTTMTLRISAVAPNPTNDGFDGYRWLRTRHIHANAQILSIDGQFVSDEQRGIIPILETWRWQLRTHFYKDWQNLSHQERQNKAITLSLLTGDRSLIDKDTKALYQLGGISHLLAISGTHVVFLAMILANMMVWLTDKRPYFYTKISRTSIRLIVMIIASMLYALFTGFDVPAVRTVYMLVAVSLARQLALPISNVGILLWVALVMIWLDPYVLWQAGFWLSFVAVWLLMQYGADETSDVGFKSQLSKVVRLQFWLFIAMLPISLWLFGKVSLWGLVINLFAVGLFGVVIVPINLLAGVLFPVLPWLSDILWGASSGILGLLHGLLGLIDEVGSSWIYQSMGKVGLILMGLSLLPLVMPILHKKYAIVPMMVLVFVMMGKPSDKGLSIKMVLDDPNLSGILIRQNGADTNSTSGQANWLVLGDFSVRSSSKNSEVIARTLTDTLKKHGVRHLTGVVVQTPSIILDEVVQELGQDIVIYRYWRANKLSTGKLVSSTCTAGELWQGNGLSVRALTGWQQIADEAVWGCTVEFNSTQMINLPPIHHDEPTRLVINGAVHDRVWELYAMLCHAPELTPRPTHLWINHPKGVMNDDVLEQFLPQRLISTKQLP